MHTRTTIRLLYRIYICGRYIHRLSRAFTITACVTLLAPAGCTPNTDYFNVASLDKYDLTLSHEAQELFGATGHKPRDAP